MRAVIEETNPNETIRSRPSRRVLRLTVLTPDIVDAILDRFQPAGMQHDALWPFPVAWDRRNAIIKQ